MSDHSARLLLPYVQPGQAQKHVTVNEGLRRIDALVQLAVESATTTAQPGSPTDGAVWILPAGKTGGDWSGFADGCLAYYRDGAWVQIAPREGWLAYVRDADQLTAFNGTNWAAFSAASLISVSATDKVLGRASPGAGVAEEIAFTDQAQALCDDTSFRAMCATMGSWHILGGSAVAVSHTGNTTETTLASLTVPGGAMGANGRLRLTSLWSYTSSANLKVLHANFGGADYLEVVGGSSIGASLQDQRIISNRNSASSQVGSHAGPGFSYTGNAPRTTSANTANNTTVSFSAQLANASETITLESWLVEVYYAA